MAYQTGTINSFSELKSILSAALTTNGWTEEVNGDVSLFKSGKCHVTCDVQDVPGIWDQNHIGFDYQQDLRYPNYEAFYYHNVPSSSSSGPFYALSAHWPITFAFDGIPEQEITFTWITGQPSNAGKWSVSGSISGAFADATVRVPYDDGGLSFGWSTTINNNSYHQYLEDPAYWVDPSTPPQIIYPLAPEQNQALAFRCGHESDGSGTLTGISPVSFQQRQSGFYSRQNDYPTATPAVDVPNNIFPVIYHLHMLSDPNEVWLIVEDSRFEEADTSVRNTWIGFGETKSQAKGYYFTGSLSQSYVTSTTNMVGDNIPFRYRSSSRSSISNGGYIYNQNYDRTLCPFFDDFSAVLYDPVVGERYKEMRSATSTSRYGVCLLGGSQSDTYSGHRRANVGRGHSSVLNQPWLCPITFEIDSVHRLNNLGYTVMVTAEINGVRHIAMDGVKNGEVISDGAENWKCYAGFERGIGQFGPETSGYFGFAVRYDGP